MGELKNQPKMNASTIAKNVMADKWANAKSNQKLIQKLQKSLKIGSGTIPGALGGGWGPVWPQGGPGLEKITKMPRNTTPFLGRPSSTWSSHASKTAILQVLLKTKNFVEKQKVSTNELPCR